MLPQQPLIKKHHDVRRLLFRIGKNNYLEESYQIDQQGRQCSYEMILLKIFKRVAGIMQCLSFESFNI